MGTGRKNSEKILQYAEKSCIMVDRDRPERACATRDPAEKNTGGRSGIDAVCTAC